MPCLKVRKPSALLFDMISTATKSYFIDQILFPYIKLNAKTYLENYWSNPVLQHDVKLLREAAKKDKFKMTIPEDGDPEDIQKAIVEYVSDALDKLTDNEALTQFKFHVLFDGYAKDRLETPVYTDVAIAIRHWAVDDGIKLFVVSNGWKEAAKRYLQKTNHGDMNLLISGHFDTGIGPLTDEKTYKKIINKLKCDPEDVIFLTHYGKEGLAAKKAGLSSILIMTHRRDISKLTEQEKKAMPVIRSFNELIFTGDAPKACELDGTFSTLDDNSKSDIQFGSKSEPMPPIVGAMPPGSKKSADGSSMGGSKQGSKQKSTSKNSLVVTSKKSTSKLSNGPKSGQKSSSNASTVGSSSNVGSKVKTTKSNKSASTMGSSSVKEDGKSNSSNSNLSVAASPSKNNSKSAASSSKEGVGRANSKSSSSTGGGSKSSSKDGSNAGGSKSAEGSSSKDGSKAGGSKSTEGSNTGSKSKEGKSPKPK